MNYREEVIEAISTGENIRIYKVLNKIEKDVALILKSLEEGSAMGCEDQLNELMDRLG